MTHQSLIDWNAVALGVISNIRRPVHPVPRLQVGKAMPRTAKRTHKSEQNRRLRMKSRELYEKLSRYYPLAKGKSIWATWDLMFNGRHEYNHSILRWPAHLGSLAVVEELKKLPKPSPRPPARSSTSAGVSLTTVTTRDNSADIDSGHESDCFDEESDYFDEESDLDSGEDGD